MKHIASLFGGLKIDKGKKIGRWQQDIVDQILEITGVEKKYPYGLWLAKIKRSGKSWGECQSIIETAKKLDSKYSKGGFIFNSLS